MGTCGHTDTCKSNGPDRLVVTNLFPSSLRRHFCISIGGHAYERGVHVSSTYDKNVEEDPVLPVVVPDHVIEAAASDKYWGPHPTTGVFGPAATAGAGAGAKEGPGNAAAAAAGNGGGPTVLDQKVWFRPLEDVDKPPHHFDLN